MDYPGIALTLVQSPEAIRRALREKMPDHHRRKLERYLAWVEFWHRYARYPG